MIQEGNTDQLQEKIMDWYNESEWEAINYILNELFTEEELEHYNETNEIDEIKDLIYSLDKSDPAKQLLKNTSKAIIFYDLNLDCSRSYNGSDDNKIAYKIAKRLKIDYKKYKDSLLNLLSNSFDGGNLTVLFECDIEDLLTPISGNKANEIKFTGDFEICIMDRTNGSGWSDKIKDLKELQLPFNRENLYLDEAAAGYSFTGDVCGMCHGGMETSISFYHKPKQKKAKINEKAKQKETSYKEWDERLKKNSKDCSPSDPRYKSHDTEYRNDFPCGNKCKNCGRFYID
jgi:hypothetical protein